MTNLLDAALASAAMEVVARFGLCLVFGLVAASLLTRARAPRESMASLAIVGVCGAWMGAEFTHLFGQAQDGDGRTVLAALIGALGLAYAWRRHHLEPSSAGMPGPDATPKLPS